MYANENGLYAGVLCGHLREMVWRLRRIPDDRWDWTFAPPAPTPRILATHAFQWLACDRQHILEPDISRHRKVPEPPREPAAICDLLEAETEEWDRLLRALTPERLAEMRRQFLFGPMSVRDFVGHMIQNSVYKNGQLATLFFALGLDGTEPYAAPFPNPIYEQVFDTRERPLFAAVLENDLAAVNALLDGGAAVNERDRNGNTPLMYAVLHGHGAIVDALLARGADPSLRDADGNAAADYARYAGHAEIAERLRATAPESTP